MARMCHQDRRCTTRNKTGWTVARRKLLMIQLLVPDPQSNVLHFLYVPLPDFGCPPTGPGSPLRFQTVAACCRVPANRPVVTISDSTIWLRRFASLTAFVSWIPEPQRLSLYGATSSKTKSCASSPPGHDGSSSIRLSRVDRQ